MVVVVVVVVVVVEGSSRAAIWFINRLRFKKTKACRRREKYINFLRTKLRAVSL